MRSKLHDLPSEVWIGDVKPEGESVLWSQRERQDYIKPYNHWLSVCCCSCRFKGHGQYVIKRGHKFIKRHGSITKVCYFVQVSPSILTDHPDLLRWFSQQDGFTCFAALWHAGALLLGCLPSCQRGTGCIAFPSLQHHCSGGGCRSGSPPDQCWPPRGLCTPSLPNFQCPRTSSGKLPACSVSVSPMKSHVTLTIPRRYLFELRNISTGKCKVTFTGLQRPCQLYAQMTRNSFITTAGN